MIVVGNSLHCPRTNNKGLVYLRSDVRCISIHSGCRIRTLGVFRKGSASVVYIR